MPGDDARPLSAGTVRVLRAAVAAIRPRGHGFDQPIDDDVLAAMVRFVPYLPGPMRLAFPVGLRLLDLGAVAIGRRRVRFTRLPVDEARAYLERVHGAGGPFAALVLGLRALVLLHFYQHPDVLAAMKIDWAGRADALVRRRGALVEGAPP